MFQLQASVKNLEFRVEISPYLPTYIQADETKLRQVLINLIGNALKFTQEGHILVKAAALQCSSGFKNDAGETSSYCCLLQFIVQDTGPGIALEEQGRLFQPFEQTETGRQSKKGSGLGLAISRNFIRLMGGDIFVQSGVNQGTSFTVEVVVSAVEMQNKPSPSIPLPPLLGVPLHPWRILLWLREGDAVSWLPQLLNQGGYQVQQVRSFEEMWESWQCWQPQVAIVHWVEDDPQLDHLIHHIRQAENDRRQALVGTGKTPPLDTFILGLGLEGTSPSMDKALRQGCDDLLIPPHKPYELIVALHSYLQSLNQALAQSSEA